MTAPVLPEGCLCGNIPRNRLGEARTTTGVLVHNFHLDCPHHGIERLGERAMKPIRVSKWMTVAECMARRMHLEEPKVLQKAPDKSKALIEWTAWVPVDDEEKAA